MKSTKLLYMEGFDVENCQAQVLSCKKSDNEDHDIILDKTCFYPRGGGQDCDHGIISGSDGTEFLVHEVTLDEDGVVHHKGEFKKGSTLQGEVQCVVDSGRRSLNTRLHSAGHLIDCAVDMMNLDWTPAKAAHYPHMSFVEYVLESPVVDYEQVRDQLQQALDDIIARGGRNEIRFVNRDELHALCKHVPSNIPTNKPVRIVLYDNTYAIPCGGTHVLEIAQLKGTKINKVKKKDKNIRVSYGVA